jgi:homoserine kinase
LDVRRLNIPGGLYVTLLLPEIRVLTSESRGILNPVVDLRKMVRQSANLGGLVLALERSDFGLLRDALEDHVIERQRAHLIPGFYAVRQAAYDAGVIGCGLSGSGPALFEFSDNSSFAEAAGIAMQSSFKAHGVTAEYFVTRVNTTGTELH